MDKELDNKGELILCTLWEFKEAVEFKDDDLINYDIYDVENDGV